ncbi:MAG: hypothetical protein JWM68_2045 [Verrucomicrobiales bacterium]|nr:hypothetical protein [Verrucomicrobiales bacterium]
MRVFAIELYRDGDFTEFKIERDGETRRIWLNTPFRGEPRELRIDSVVVSGGAAEVGQLVADVDEWWQSLSTALQDRAREALAHKGAFYNPASEMRRAIDVSRVIHVRDYVSKIYGA